MVEDSTVSGSFHDCCIVGGAVGSRRNVQWLRHSVWLEAMPGVSVVIETSLRHLGSLRVTSQSGGRLVALYSGMGCENCWHNEHSQKE